MKKMLSLMFVSLVVLFWAGYCFTESQVKPVPPTPSKPMPPVKPSDSGLRPSIQPDISIESVTHTDGQPITSISYDPNSPLRLPIKIAVKFTGDYCPTKIVIKGIQVGTRAPVFPPIQVPRPDSSGISYIDTFITIQSGLQPGEYSFEVFKLPGDRCPDSNPNNDRKIVSLRLSSQPPSQSDYAIEAITLADGNPLEKGCLYSPEIPPLCKIKAIIKWNKINPPYGVACTLGAFLHGERYARPLGDVPLPDARGISVLIVDIDLPRGKNPGDILPYSLRIIPSDPACDSNSANNVKNFNIKLVRMSGDDFVVDIKGIKWEDRLTFKGWMVDYAYVKLRIANISGNQTKQVEVRAWHSANSYDEALEAYNKKVSITVKPKQWEEKEIRLIMGWLIDEITEPIKFCAEVVYNGVEIDKSNNKVCVYAKPKKP